MFLSGIVKLFQDCQCVVLFSKVVWPQEVVPYPEENVSLVQVLNTDEEIAIKCQYVARPEASITWKGFNNSIWQALFQNNTAFGNDTRKLLTRSSKYLKWKTSDVEERKHGSGDIECEAKNSADTSSITVKLDVQCENV